MCFWYSLVQRFSVSVSDKKSAEAKAGHLDKLSGSGGGSLAATAGPVSSARDDTSVKKEPLESHRDRGVSGGGSVITNENIERDLDWKIPKYFESLPNCKKVSLLEQQE